MFSAQSHWFCEQHTVFYILHTTLGLTRESTDFYGEYISCKLHKVKIRKITKITANMLRLWSINGKMGKMTEIHIMYPGKHWCTVQYLKEAYSPKKK